METTDDASPVKLRGRRDLNILLEPRVIHIGGDEIKAQVLQRLAFFALRHFDLMWNQFCIKYTKCYEENEKRVFARLSHVGERNRNDLFNIDHGEGTP